MSRFLKLKWDLDEELERNLIEDKDLSDIIKSIRTELHSRQYDLFMRDVLNFKALLKINIKLKEAAKSTIFREINDDAVIEKLLKLFNPVETDDENSEYEEIKVEFVD
jgi:hypothetical protein